MTTAPTTPLVRPRSGRVLAGVAAGLASRTDLPVWLIRIGFVLLMPAGGSGLLLYLAGWALIPEEGDTRAAAGRFVENLHGTRAAVGIGLFALAMVIVAGNTGIFDADLALAAVLFVVGVLLYRGDLRRSHASTEPNEREAMMTTTGTTAGTAETTGALAGTGIAEPPPPPPPTTNPGPPPPAAGPPPPPRPPRPAPPPSHLGRLTVAAVFIVLGVLAFLDTIGAIDMRPRQYLATGLVVVGAGLIVGAFVGRARWLIVIGIFALPAVVVAPIADVGFDGRFEADRLRYSPATVEEIQDSYTGDVADMVVDLSAVDFAGESVEVEASIDVGELVVIVPDDVAVDASGQVDVGEVEVLGRSSGGLGDVRVAESEPGTNGSLIVAASADLGRVEVSREGGGAPSIRNTGDLDVTVAAPAELQTSYSVDVGNVTLDLSELRLETRREVEVSTDSGNVSVLLPEAGRVEVVASVDSGSIVTPGGERTGIDRTAEYRNGENPLLVLDVEVGVGSISIEESS